MRICAYSGCTNPPEWQKWYCGLHHDSGTRKRWKPKPVRPAAVKVAGHRGPETKAKLRRNSMNCPNCGLLVPYTTDGWLSFHYFVNGCWRGRFKA